MKARDAVLLIVVQRSTMMIVQYLHLWVCNALLHLDGKHLPIYLDTMAKSRGPQPKGLGSAPDPATCFLTTASLGFSAYP